MDSISVVIPATRYDESLIQCLESLCRQRDVQIECWVVFNPRKFFFRSEWPEWVHFVHSARGVNCARNKGLTSATRDHVLFLDSDCRLEDPLHIQKILRFMESKPRAWAVGGIYALPPDANVESRAYHFLQMDWLAQECLNSEGKSRALIGGHMLIKKSRLNGEFFDERIKFGGSEREFFLRRSQKDDQIFLSWDLSVPHFNPMTEKSLIRKARAQGLGERYIRTLPHFRKSKGRRIFYQSTEGASQKWIRLYRRYFSEAAGFTKRDYKIALRFYHSCREILKLSQSRRD